MSKKFHLYNIILVLSFFSLWISIQIPDYIEFILAYFLILTVGVGHGANDLKIFFNSKNLNTKRTLAFIVIYSFIVLAGFALFFVVPSFILTIFLLTSGYHFGQEHFEKYNLAPSWWLSIFVTSYGFNIILYLLVQNADESILIINDLINNPITYDTLLYSLLLSATIMTITGIVIFRSLAWQHIVREVFYLIVISLLFQNTSLVLGFAIYFILWHSVPSIYNQIAFLDGKVTATTIINYVTNSLLYWIGALIFLGVLYYFLKDHTSLFLSTIIAFLGGITFPHVIVMNKLHKN
jgi:Brp/Blh family beta-carotene 15,15'-monooxygenase